MKNEERSKLMEKMSKMYPKPRFLEIDHDTFNALSDDDVESIKYIYGTKIVKKEIKDAN